MRAMAKAKPKAKAVARGKAKAKAKAKARVGRRLRRPAAVDPGGEARAGVPGGSPEELWKAGGDIQSHVVDPRWIAKGDRLVLTKASYYGGEVQVAGDVEEVAVNGTDLTVGLLLTRTLNDRVLTWSSSQTPPRMKVHLCPSGCNKEEVADHILHCQVLRKVVKREEEEGWTTNLVVPAQVEADDLHLLRQRGRDLEDPTAEVTKKKRKKEDEEESSESKKKSKKKKGKKKKESKKKKKNKAEKSEAAKPDPSGKGVLEKKEVKKVESSEESSEDESIYSGRHPKAASRKDPTWMFRGTGLDVADKVRRRVFRRARKHLRKKERSSSSGTGSSSSSTGLDEQEMENDGIFQQASKVRRIGELYPGALGAQALVTMRSQLLTEVGIDEGRQGLRGIGIPYFRQFLSRRGSAPQQRELQTLLTAVDNLLAGKIAGTIDLLLQRVKSCQAMMEGSHWTVAQRLELLGPESQMVVPMPELSAARKDIYEEARARGNAANVEGRPSYGKGQGKPKGEANDNRKGGGKERKQGKWQGSKGDQGKKGPEGVPKAAT